MMGPTALSDVRACKGWKQEVKFEELDEVFISGVMSFLVISPRTHVQLKRPKITFLPFLCLIEVYEINSSDHWHLYYHDTEFTARSPILRDYGFRSWCRDLRGATFTGRLAQKMCYNGSAQNSFIRRSSIRFILSNIICWQQKHHIIKIPTLY